MLVSVCCSPKTSCFVLDFSGEEFLLFCFVQLKIFMVPSLEQIAPVFMFALTDYTRYLSTRVPLFIQEAFK